MRDRVDMEASGGDLGSAFGAPAEFIAFDPPERCEDAALLHVPTSLRFLRHLLTLHEVHAREAANRLLIEGYRRLFVGAGPGRRFQRRQSLQQPLAHFCNVSHKKL